MKRKPFRQYATCHTPQWAIIAYNGDVPCAWICIVCMHVKQDWPVHTPDTIVHKRSPDEHR